MDRRSKRILCLPGSHISQVTRRDTDLSATEEIPTSLRTSRMQACSIFAFCLLIAKALCDETISAESGIPIQTDSIDAIAIPYGAKPTLNTAPPASVADASDSVVTIDPTSPCIGLDCLRPTPAWVSHPSTIEITTTATPVGLYRGATHVKIVGVLGRLPDGDEVMRELRIAEAWFEARQTSSRGAHAVFVSYPSSHSKTPRCDCCDLRIIGSRALWMHN
ncbi:hypothetical protein C8Q73DRAFT_311046 [Cubamyces lactineus]|nr:hypothetical protein C8Q73DRAFT_311046 [Cubamyces lactineus]